MCGTPLRFADSAELDLHTPQVRFCTVYSRTAYTFHMARPRTFDEADVVEAAREHFWTHGYSATSVDDLTAATGLGKGSLYGAFGDKHSLFVRALDDYCTTASDRFSAQLRQPGVTAIDRLTGHVRAIVADVIADTEGRGCLMAKSSAELGGADADVDRIVGESLRRWRSDLVDALVEAQADGAITAGADAQALATVFLGVLRGMEVLRRGGVEPAQLRAAGEQLLAMATVATA
jgi:TetR/AcrR family transcriptional regulator, transcriptional repressor for nem operon